MVTWCTPEKIGEMKSIERIGITLHIKNIPTYSSKRCNTPTTPAKKPYTPIVTVRGAAAEARPLALKKRRLVVTRRNVLK